MKLSTVKPGPKPNLYLSGVLWNRESILRLLPLIDCSPENGCKRCCVEPSHARVQEQEIERIAEYTGRSAKRLKKKWFHAKDDYRLSMPCEFRGPKGCSIWKVRPAVCNYFPLQRVDNEGQPCVAVFTGWCEAGRRCIAQLEAWQEGR